MDQSTYGNQAGYPPQQQQPQADVASGKSQTIIFIHTFRKFMRSKCFCLIRVSSFDRGKRILYLHRAAHGLTKEN
jgi:hypothetical protein